MRTRIWFDPPLFRWSRVLVLAALGGAGVVAWLAHERGMWGVPVLAPGVVLAPAASGAAIPASVPRTVVAVPVAAPVQASGPPRAPAADETDPCTGVAAAPRTDADAQAADDAARQRPTTPLRERWLAAMRTRGDARTRAAGLLLSNRQFDDDAATEQLVRLAQDSRDAMVYGWALYACQGRNGAANRAPNACLMLSHDQWAALAPNQATPWLYLASDDARPRRVDPAEAMYRASRADTLGATAGALPALVLGAQPAGAGPTDRHAMLTEAIALSKAIQARTPHPSRQCATAMLADANRRQQCEALAQLYAGKADSAMDLVVAKGLGGLLGWPDERLKALGDEAAAVQRLEASATGAPASCAAIERLVAHVGEVARVGEVAAAREFVRRSGRTMQEFAAAGPKDAAAAARPAPPGSAPGL